MARHDAPFANVDTASDDTCLLAHVGHERQADYVKGGWNYTGDAYLQDADGYFFYQSRTDDMIISAGYNIATHDGRRLLRLRGHSPNAPSSASPTKSAARSSRPSSCCAPGTAATRRW